MDIKDVKKVVDDLQNKPFLCSKEAIETDSGYVITQKGVKGNEDKKRAESTGNMYRSVKQKHIKHILGKIGTVKEVRNIPDMEILAYYVHFRYVNLKAAPGNKKPYYVFLEDMIEPINLTVVDGKKED